MNIRITLFLLGIFCSSAAFGQSVVTLDSVDLVGKGETSLMGECLFLEDGAKCRDAEYGGATEITLDDVVNLGVIDRSQVARQSTSQAHSTAPLPSIDLEIAFAYDSDVLTSVAYTKLSDLVRLMDDPRLKNQKLVFIGHTDAIGSQAYNLELSQRRADAVARYVRTITGVAQDRVAAVGVGFAHLKNRFDPIAAENRRVQLVLVPVS